MQVNFPLKNLSQISWLYLT